MTQTPTRPRRSHGSPASRRPLSARDAPQAAALFATDSLLARPGGLHLEPQDRRGPRRASPTSSAATARRVADPSALRASTEPRRRGRRRHHRVDRLRDRRRPRSRAAAAGRRRTARTAPGRCSPRSTSSRVTRSRAARTARWVRSTAPPSSASTWKEQRQAGGREPRQHHPALRPRRRRRAGWHRARLPPAAARRTEPGDRQAPAPGRPVAQPLQVALPPRPGLVRPPALPEVPRQLAGLRAQGQDRRLARVLRRRSWRCPTGRAPRPRAPPGPTRPRSGPSRSSARASP